MTLTEDEFFVLRRARTYKTSNNRRVALHIFSKDRTRLDRLAKKFGGNTYPHGSGLTWIVGAQSELAEIYRVICNSIPSPCPKRLEALVEAMERRSVDGDENPKRPTDSDVGECRDDPTVPAGGN